jgi:hypothetical protein
MTDEFALIITYKGREQHFTARMIPQGFTHRFQVSLPETDVFFEPDEEGGYRAITMPGQDEKILSKIDKGLLAGIQLKIEEILA